MATHKPLSPPRECGKALQRVISRGGIVSAVRDFLAEHWGPSRTASLTLVTYQGYSISAIGACLNPGAARFHFCCVVWTYSLRVLPCNSSSPKLSYIPICSLISLFLLLSTRFIPEDALLCISGPSCICSHGSHSFPFTITQLRRPLRQ